MAVPNCTHRLLERPRLAAFPLEVIAAEVLTKRSPRALFEYVPRADEVERWVGRSHTADTQNSDQTAVPYK